ncbi:MAG: T9SS type A sorting domain-containing protein [Bacteroidota bacterium]
MKKSLLFFFGLFLSFGMSAQVLLQQDFSAGTMPPTGWMVMGNLQNWVISQSSNASGAIPEMQVKNTPSFNSSMRIISSQVNTTGLTQIIIRFKHMFDHADGNSSPFTIGLDTRSNSGTWTNVWTNAVTTDIGAETVTVLVNNANVGAANFQFSLTVNGSSQNFKNWYVDDIEVLNPLSLDGAMASIDIPPLFVGKQAVKGEFSNLGQTAITSADISYQATDGGEVFTTSFNSLNVATGSSQAFECTDSLDVPAGLYDLKVWISNINGAPADDNPANDTLVKSISVPTQLIYYRPFFEEFTSSTCGPCASFNNSTLNPFIAQHEDDLTLVKYQMNWPGSGDPYYTAEGGVRRTYYGVNAVPDMYIDGKKVATSSAGVNGGFNATYGTMTYVSITSQHEIQGNNVNIDANIQPYANYPDVKVHMAIVEHITTQNVATNGETEFHNVMMKMVPDASGTTASLISGQPLNLKFNMNMSSTNVEEMDDLMVAIFIQDNATKGIHQSGYSVEVGAFVNVSIEEGATEVLVDEPIVLDFSQAVRMVGGQAITNSNVAGLILLKEGSITGADAGFTATINTAKTQIVVTPNPNLKYDQRYFFKLMPVENNSSVQTLPVTRNFTTDLNVGVPQLTSTDVRIYPNPASNMLYISNISGISKVDIFSVVGNLVKTVDNFPNSRGQAGISVSDLPAGMYIIRMRGSQKDITSRFVISR